MSTRTPDRSAKGDATRAALVAAARKLFVANGYFATGTEDIVAEAAVGTRGALYHHFADKQDLFRAVFHQVQTDLAAATVIDERDDRLDMLIAALQQFLDASAENPDVQQVLLIDGPAVLGWEEWRRIDSQHSLGMVRMIFEANIAAGNIPPQPVEPLAHLIVGALNEAALAVAAAEDAAGARESFAVSMEGVLDALRAMATDTPKRAAHQ